MAERRGFEYCSNGRYIFGNETLIIILDIQERDDNSFSVVYNKQRPYPQARYHGEFGRKGGYRNYAARRLVERLSELPVSNQAKAKKHRV